ncbi:Retrovirus-related Pol polyprotein from transposon opus, partial [Stegodyphus mimosarum]
MKTQKSGCVLTIRNLITKTDAEPMPRIDAVLDQLTNATIFSTLDLASGYWHIKLNEKDTEKLVFSTNFGLYEFNSLPFGWKNSPAVFQKTLKQLSDSICLKKGKKKNENYAGENRKMKRINQICKSKYYFC